MSKKQMPQLYVVSPHVTVLAEGIDPTRLNALADELEDAEILAKLDRASAHGKAKR